MKQPHKIWHLWHFVLIVLCLGLATGRAQINIPKSITPTPAPPQVVQADLLGRSTPRGTVLGFLLASRNDDPNAVDYLNTSLKQDAAQTLAHQLYVVLDRRLPARLDQVSDRPEGAGSVLSRTDKNIIGTIRSSEGEIDIVVERVPGTNAGPIWLFSKETLEAVPFLYGEVTAVNVEDILPEFMLGKVAEIPLYEWFALLVGLPGIYLLMLLLSRILSALVFYVRTRVLGRQDAQRFEILPVPVRLLLVVGAIRWLLSLVSLPFLARQFWFSVGRIILISAVVWVIVNLLAWGEIQLRKRLDRTSPASALLRFTRRMADFIVIVAGILLGLSLFGVNVTAALAGLGVGGIAVALAAQKTLENVIGGVSIIIDRALSVGDQLKWGESLGTVESIGLRSTRIRTFDRTLLYIPNGQVSTAVIEVFSKRDKFWFNHTVRVRYDTSPSQLQTILKGIRNLVDRDARIEDRTFRVQFLRFGTSSLDIEVFAYVFASDYVRFLAIQEELLLEIMKIIESAGTSLALPSQMTYLAGSSPLGSDASIGPADSKHSGPSLS